MKYALIENGIVKQIVDNKFPFAENEVVFFKQCNDDVKENYLYKDDKFTAPPEPEKIEPTYIEKRLAEYGTPQKQLEFITEHGLDAWQAKVEEIKKQIPKE